MKEDIMQRLTVTLTALNTVNVSGKSNLANLSGSIAMLEEVCAILDKADITLKDAAEQEK